MLYDLWRPPSRLPSFEDQAEEEQEPREGDVRGVAWDCVYTIYIYIYIYVY